MATLIVVVRDQATGLPAVNAEAAVYGGACTEFTPQFGEEDGGSLGKYVSAKVEDYCVEALLESILKLPEVERAYVKPDELPYAR